MQQWEFFVDDVTALTQPADAERHAAFTKMRDLGLKGWELVSLASHGGRMWAAYRRPVQQAAAVQAQSTAQAAQPMYRGKDLS